MAPFITHMAWGYIYDDARPGMKLHPCIYHFMLDGTPVSQLYASSTRRRKAHFVKMTLHLESVLDHKHSSC